MRSRSAISRSVAQAILKTRPRSYASRPRRAAEVLRRRRLLEPAVTERRAASRWDKEIRPPWRRISRQLCGYSSRGVRACVRAVLVVDDGRKLEAAGDGLMERRGRAARRAGQRRAEERRAGGQWMTELWRVRTLHPPITYPAKRVAWWRNG